MKTEKIMEEIIRDIKRNGFYNPATGHFVETPLDKEKGFANYYLTDFLVEKKEKENLDFLFEISFELVEKVTFKKWLEGKRLRVNTTLTIFNKEKNEKAIARFTIWDYCYKEFNAYNKWLMKKGYTSYKDYLKAEKIL